MVENLIPKPFIVPAYTIIFFIVMLLVVPRAEIKRLAIYSIIFGAVLNVFFLIIGKLLGTLKYIHYEPFGLMGIPFFAPISWAIYYIMYFYFLPEGRVLRYLYLISGIGYGVFFGTMLRKLGILEASSIFTSLMVFSIWFPIATFGYIFLSQEERPPKAIAKGAGSQSLFSTPEPSRKPKKKKLLR